MVSMVIPFINVNGIEKRDTLEHLSLAYLWWILNLGKQPNANLSFSRVEMAN